MFFCSISFFAIPFRAREVSSFVQSLEALSLLVEILNQGQKSELVSTKHMKMAEAVVFQPIPTHVQLIPAYKNVFF